MTTKLIEPSERVAAGGAERQLRRLGVLSVFAAWYTYALIVFGGIVRITNSGMGCGDDWPRCNGQWIPPFTLETLIEYTHRLLAAGIGLVVIAVFAYAVAHRRAPAIGGRGGPLRPLLIGAVLLVMQIALGAITVRLELPTSVTVAHFITALLFMATLIVAAVRSGALGGSTAPIHPVDPAAARRAWRMAAGAVVLGFVVVSFGALTANTPVAPQACRGFPLCSGSWLPTPDLPAAHLHWTHRVLAFLLFFHVLAAVLLGARHHATHIVRRAAGTTFALILAQLAIAAALVTLPLPWQLQALHLAAGAAIWFAVIAWAELARVAAHRGTASLS
jgi:cytochrome c oxidase assembly protein subunit 15